MTFDRERTAIYTGMAGIPAGIQAFYMSMQTIYTGIHDTGNSRAGYLYRHGYLFTLRGIRTNRLCLQRLFIIIHTGWFYTPANFITLVFHSVNHEKKFTVPGLPAARLRYVATESRI